MIISAHQPTYLPWLGFVHKIICSDVFVIMDDVQFEKNSFANRNKILQNETEILLTIPLSMKNHLNKTIKEMTVANHVWKKKHWKSICQCYSNSRNFHRFEKAFETLFLCDSSFFIDYCDMGLSIITDYLDLDTKIVKSSTLNISGKKNEYIIEMVKKLNGTAFLFGANGKTYADRDLLKTNGIIPFFQSYSHPVYDQPARRFHPCLTVFDLLFNMPETKVIETILKGNRTKKDFYRQLNPGKTGSA